MAFAPCIGLRRKPKRAGPLDRCPILAPTQRPAPIQPNPLMLYREGLSLNNQRSRRRAKLKSRFLSTCIPRWVQLALASITMLLVAFLSRAELALSEGVDPSTEL